MILLSFILGYHFNTGKGCFVTKSKIYRILYTVLDSSNSSEFLTYIMITVKLTKLKVTRKDLYDYGNAYVVQIGKQYNQIKKYVVQTEWEPSCSSARNHVIFLKELDTQTSLYLND